jgi:DNA (cytosine-5)-methyltransferase 1
MNYRSDCSGIEAASAAWHPLGWTPVSFSEIDPFPAAVLRARFPNVPNVGDFTMDERTDYGNIDLMVAGTPCQDFSVAGKRAGFDGFRGSLTFAWVDLVRRIMPIWLVWENVPGVIDETMRPGFRIFLQRLSELGYGLAWRVLDAQYVRVDGFPFAVPQRRRRVFLIGHLGDWRPAVAVLAEPEILRGDSPPRREAGQGFARDVANCLGSTGSKSGSRVGDTRGQDNVVCADIASTLNAHYGSKQGLENQHINQGCPLFVTSITGSVSHALTTANNGKGCSEDGTGRGVPIVAFSCKDNGRDCQNNIAPTLRSMGNDTSHANAGGQLAVAIQERAVCENENAGPGGKGFSEDGCAYTLEARAKVQAVAMQEAQTGCREYDTAGSLRANGPGHDPVGTRVRDGMTVRRLTPLECERLQGFPDHWTAIDIGRRRRIEGPEADYLRWHGFPVTDAANGKLYTTMAADGPRYKAIGNSMAGNVIEWLGRRIEMVERLLKRMRA